MLSKHNLRDLGNPVDAGRKLNAHKTFRRRPGHLLNVLCTFNLHPVSTGKTLKTDFYLPSTIYNSGSFITKEKDSLYLQS